MLAPARGLGFLSPAGARLVKTPAAGSHSHRYWDAGSESTELRFALSPPNMTNTLRASSKAAVCRKRGSGPCAGGEMSVQVATSLAGTTPSAAWDDSRPEPGVLPG